MPIPPEGDRLTTVRLSVKHNKELGRIKVAGQFIDKNQVIGYLIDTYNNLNSWAHEWATKYMDENGWSVEFVNGAVQGATSRFGLKPQEQSVLYGSILKEIRKKQGKG